MMNISVLLSRRRHAFVFLLVLLTTNCNVPLASASADGGGTGVNSPCRGGGFQMPSPPSLPGGPFGGSGVAKKRLQSQTKQVQKANSIDEVLIQNFLGPVAKYPTLYQMGDIALTIGQAYFTKNYLTGEAQVLWACHLIIHTILMFTTDYGVTDRRLRWTWPKVPFYVMGGYDLWFFCTVFIHFLACPEGYPLQ